MANDRVTLFLVLFVFAPLDHGRLTWVYGETSKNSADCVTQVKQFEVRGSSLAPFINPGQTIKLFYGYYNCGPVQREDVVAYQYAGNKAPIIKIVKAVPSDKWRLKRDQRRHAYQILVNDRPIKNSEGRLYQIPEANSNMLKLYARNYPVLPANTYLLLGNQPAGSLDATRFGLIDKADILGKVEICENPSFTKTDLKMLGQP